MSYQQDSNQERLAMCNIDGRELFDAVEVFSPKGKKERTLMLDRDGWGPNHGCITERLKALKAKGYTYRWVASYRGRKDLRPRIRKIMGVYGDTKPLRVHSAHQHQRAAAVA